MKKELTIRKIHLEKFMDLLMDLYMDGVVFFDIEACPKLGQDLLKVIVREEYFEGFEEQAPKDPSPLTREILNALIYDTDS